MRLFGGRDKKQKTPAQPEMPMPYGGQGAPGGPVDLRNLNSRFAYIPPAAGGGTPMPPGQPVPGPMPGGAPPEPARPHFPPGGGVMGTNDLVQENAVLQERVRKQEVSLNMMQSMLTTTEEMKNRAESELKQCHGAALHLVQQLCPEEIDRYRQMGQDMERWSAPQILEAAVNAIGPRLRQQSSPAEAQELAALRQRNAQLEQDLALLRQAAAQPVTPPAQELQPPVQPNAPAAPAPAPKPLLTIDEEEIAPETAAPAATPAATDTAAAGGIPEVLQVKLEDLKRRMSDSHRAIIREIGRTGIARTSELRDTEAMTAAFKSRAAFDGTFDEIKKMNLVDYELLDYGWKQARTDVFTLTQLGQLLYTQLAGQEPVVSERIALTEQYGSIARAYYLRDVEAALKSVGYETRILPPEEPGRVRMGPDIEATRSGKTIYVLVEPSVEESEVMNVRLDAMFELTQEWHVVAPSGRSLDREVRPAVFQWVVVHKKGRENIPGLTVHFGVIDQIRNEIWAPPIRY